MNRTRLLAVLIASLSLGGTLSLLRGEAPGASIEQQLRSQYRVSSVNAIGGVVQLGTVLVVAQAGIKEAPPSDAGCWYNSHKPGGGISYSRGFEGTMPPDLTSQVRLLPVGGKVVIVRLDVKRSEVIFCVQSATIIGSEGDPNCAAVFFQFPQRNFVQPANLKAIQDSIAEVFSIATSKPEPPAPAPAPETPGEPQVAGPSLDQVAGLYVMTNAKDRQLQLNSDGTYLLVLFGKNYPGTFTVDANKLIICPTGVCTSIAPFTIQGDTLVNRSGSEWVKQKAAPAATLRLPATYVSAQAPADQLRLNADNSFSLQAGGETYHGTFVVNGDTVELNIRETGDKTTAKIQGSNLTDSNGQAWIQREQSVSSAPDETTLRNEDIIKMVKAGLDDAILIAKIGSSKCQFDTSTDALIQLKKSGVSAAVLKAILAAKK